MDTMEKLALQVVRRDGQVVPFDADRIRVALVYAFLNDAQGERRRRGINALSNADHDQVGRLAAQVIERIRSEFGHASAIGVETIQDLVEQALMLAGEHEVARDYVLVRHSRHARRGEAAGRACQARDAVRIVRDGIVMSVDRAQLQAMLAELGQGLADVSVPLLVDQVLRDAFDGMTAEQFEQALLMAVRAQIERDPDYERLAARLLLRQLAREVMPDGAPLELTAAAYGRQLRLLIDSGSAAGRLDRGMAGFDLTRLADALRPERDLLLPYRGLQILADRYLLRSRERCIELPQTFFMRVAMGLALLEDAAEARAIEFYESLSTLRFMCSSPTLFNSGTTVPQLSSCYVTTIDDDLDAIYSALRDNALLQKYAGGLGNDWTRVRALGAHIAGTHGKSQGVVPFMKVASDTALAVNQGGKRKGAVCAYLETWHLDIEAFLELRRNVGDDRRRTHDMDTAHWIPDLFMQRVQADAEWTLFSPDDVPDLHDRVGLDFARAYAEYEKRADAGDIRLFKRVGAVALWRKMLSMLFETGHPWICFKDACNLRSPQRHVGVVHSSNLCTEITLNTADDEIAVCNLGSVNLAAHLLPGQTDPLQALDLVALERTVTTAMRMLDNVVDINHYAVAQAENANLRHRPVGLGVMGLQDCLYRLRLPFASDAAVAFGSRAVEAICYFAYQASSGLARERGCYPSYRGSDWERGILPPDTLDRLAQQRHSELGLDAPATLDWTRLRERIRHDGMRNSNCVAIAPTATIANIVGVTASIEPSYRNLYVKSNLSGEFTVVNGYLVADLKRLGLWDDVMLADLKYDEGSVQGLERVPAELKARYATAFEIPYHWVVDAAACRQKWMDQSQSLNLYFAAPTGRMLDEAYRRAWQKGLKTTYYLRGNSASVAEKSTTRGGALNAVPSRPCDAGTVCDACAG